MPEPGNDSSLRKNVAIVTGATGALGRAVVRKLLEKGAVVVAVYRDEKKYRDLAASVGGDKAALTGIAGDVMAEERVRMIVEEVIRRHRRIDILVNLVGAYKGGEDIAATPEADWDFLMGINLKAAFLCAKAVLPSMIKANYGRIINVAARPAVEKRGRAKSGAYAVSKAGVVILTETIAEEVKKFNITANCVMPSIIDTAENRRSFPSADFSKWVKPEEIALVLLFLVSEDAAVISGATIPVYGKA
jgi:NAD(P)-dependent dehydrogenase (short-subunit alcohol dehydrogenase family)